MDGLSDKTLLNIMRFLDKVSLLKLGRTCRKLGDVSNDMSLWKDDILVPYISAKVQIPSSKGKFEVHKLTKCRRCDSMSILDNGALDCLTGCDICERLVCSIASRVSISHKRVTEQIGVLLQSKPWKVGDALLITKHICLDCLHKLPREILQNRLICDKSWDTCQSYSIKCPKCSKKIRYSCGNDKFDECIKCKSSVCRNCSDTRWVYKDDRNVSTAELTICLDCDGESTTCECDAEACFCRFNHVLILGQVYVAPVGLEVCKACHDGDHTC
jgi:hypothetical protein